jgi:phage FluMu gp28-like protein
VVNVGRRAGKTWLGLDRCATKETLPYAVAWFSPTYKMLLEVWREAVRTFAPITARRTVQERRLEFVTGGLLEFWSLENPDVARGRKYARIIVDEAAMVPNLMDIWQYALRPTLADYAGDAWFLSTPKGRNGFWQMFQWGQDPEMADWQSWQMPSMVGMISQAEIDEMRRTLPERAFQQEILAQFVDDGGGVFRRVLEAATAQPQQEAIRSHQYVFGVDWARDADFTVISVIDVREQALVYLDRFNQIDYVVQMGRLQALYERFRPTTIMAEANAMGQPLIDQLRRTGLPVQPFTTTNATKAAAIDALGLAFEQGKIRILNDPVLIAELQAYAMERLPSGLLRYSAPEGMHDDCVMSLALAWQAASVPAKRAARSYEG